MEKIKVLVIDDHPFVSEAVEIFFQNMEEEIVHYRFEIHKAENCEQGYKLVLQKRENSFNVILLDIQLPPYRAEEINSGEDLGHAIKSSKINTKIIVMTSLTDNYRLYNIFKNLNPDGILVKSDITQSTIVESILAVLKDKTYYSVTFSAILRNHHSNDYALDETDRKLLYYLSQGYRTKELPSKMLLSLPAIEKRKRNLKKIFTIESALDRDLIFRAKEKGFL